MYKVALKGSPIQFGDVFQSLKEAWAEKESRGSEYAVYQLETNLSRFGYPIRSWRKVE